MASRRLYKLLIFLCLICIVNKMSIVSLFFPQLGIWEIPGHDVYPLLTPPLSEYEYLIWDNTKQEKFFNETFYQIYPFVKLCPTLNISYLRYYNSPQRLTDNRIRIRYLILAHFHGSRYKDGISLSKIL